MKVCTVCAIEKPLGDYYSRAGVNGPTYGGCCKACRKDKARKWRVENREKKREADRLWRENNKEKKKEMDRVWRENNSDRKKENDKRYREENKEKIKKNKKEYYEKNGLKYLFQSISKRLHEKTNGEKKPKEIKVYLGCDESFLKKWFEFQFTSKMSWENYPSYWHIDHVVPCSSFDLSKEDELKKCFEWKNCRPLKKEKNRSKSYKMIPKEILLQEIRVRYFENIK